MFRLHPDIVRRIARRQWRLSSWLLVVGAFQCCSGRALAQPATKQAAAGARSGQPSAGSAQPPEPEPPEPEPPETYRGLLAGAYVLAPLLGRIAGNGVLRATGDQAVAIAVGSTTLVLPAGVHAYEAGSRRALTSFSLMLGSMAVGAVVVTGLYYALGPFMCVDNCHDRTPIPATVSAPAGAGLGYVIFAVYDVINHASVPAAPSRGQQGSTLSFGVFPLLPRSAQLESARRLGLQLGATVEF